MSPLRRAGFSAAASAPGCRAASEGNSGSRGRGERLLLLPQGRRGRGRGVAGGLCCPRHPGPVSRVFARSLTARGMFAS